jgi:lysozyme
MDMNRLMRTLEQDEAFRRSPYRCTSGKLTIGIGWNIDDVPMRYSEARFRLRNDIDECVSDLENIFSGQWPTLPDAIQEVLINMRFQLGEGGFRGFRKMIGAVKGWDFEKMAEQMRDSRWHKQTTNRAERLIHAVKKHYKEDCF